MEGVTGGRERTGDMEVQILEVEGACHLVSGGEGMYLLRRVMGEAEEEEEDGKERLCSLWREERRHAGK